jgi:hypothetical protein
MIRLISAAVLLAVVAAKPIKTDIKASIFIFRIYYFISA